MGSVVNAAATIFIGAKLGDGFKSIFGTAERAAFKLGTVVRDTNKQLAAANSVVKYGTLLKDLEKKQAEAGGSNKSLAAGIANVEKLFAKAKQEARGYGLEIGNIAREQQRLSLKSKLATIGAANIVPASKMISGAAGAATALFLSTKNLKDENQELQNQAQILGMTTKALQEYRAIAEGKGLSNDAFSEGIKSQADVISIAAKGIGAGAGKTRRAIHELGLDIQFLQNLSPDKQFNLIADSINKLGNQNDKIRIANELWQGNASAMLNMAAIGSEGLKKMREEIDKTGIVLDENSKKNLSIFDNKLTDITLGLRGIQTQIVVGALPSLISLATGAGVLVGGISKGIVAIGGFKTIVAVLGGVALPTLIGAIPALVLGIQAIGLAITANPLGLFLKVMSVGIALAIANWDKIGPVVGKTIDWIGAKAKWLFEHTPIGLLFKGGELLYESFAKLPTAAGNRGGARDMPAASAAVAAAMRVPIATVAGGGGGGTVIHPGAIAVYAAPGMNEQQLAQQVMQHINEHERRAQAKQRGAHHD